MATGIKTGGRKKGVPNKASTARVEALAVSGLTPLDYMLGLMRDTSQEIDVRFEAAKGAAPYIHPKLANLDHKHDVSETLEQLLLKSMSL